MDMPLTERQVEFADAALRVLERDGMAAVSFRSVAAEAGWSLGAMQKAFASKDALLAAMFARFREAEVALPAQPPGQPTLADWLTELFLLTQPLDESRRSSYLRANAFGELAVTDPHIGAAIAASDAEIAGLLAGLVRRAQSTGEVPAAVDPDATAWAFLALAQGSASRLLYAPDTEARVAAIARTTIATLLHESPVQATRNP